MSIKRRFVRQFDRDRIRINQEFLTVVTAFQETLFGHNWDDPNLSQYPIFEKYNEVWIEFCDRWNTEKIRAAKPDPLAFFKFAIDDTIPIVTLPEQAQVQKKGENEETQGAEGRPEKSLKGDPSEIDEIRR